MSRLGPRQPRNQFSAAVADFSSACKPALRSRQAPNLWVTRVKTAGGLKVSSAPYCPDITCRLLSLHGLVLISTVTILFSAAVQQAEGICCHILPLFGSYPNPRQSVFLFDLVGYFLTFSHESIYVYDYSSNQLGVNAGYSGLNVHVKVDHISSVCLFQKLQIVKRA